MLLFTVVRTRVRTAAAAANSMSAVVVVVLLLLLLLLVAADGSISYCRRSALKRMAPDTLQEGEVSPYKGRQTKQAQVVTDLGPHTSWPYVV